jgi:hypothetical protein
MNEQKSKSNSERLFVVVTTDKRGVFAGYGPAAAESDGSIRLEEAQMCVYWTSEVKGVLGLAATGPVKGCRIGPTVPAIVLNGVTAVMETTAQSEKQWKAQPWN